MALSDLVLLLFVALSGYRVAHMLVYESGPARLFERWRGFWIARYPGWVAEGMTCILCMSFWLGWVFALLPLPRVVLLALSASALTVLWERSHE